MGEAWTRSKAYTEGWLARFPDGAPSGPGPYRSDPVKVQGGVRSLLVGADSTSAGALVGSQFLGLLGPGASRPLTLLALLTVIGVNSDTIEFARESTRVSAAAPVAEATALTGTSGTKPEGGLTFAIVTAAVRTFAVWIPATKRILSDAPQLRAYIDDALAADLRTAIESQVSAGSGTGENLLGILNTPGILTEPAPGAGESFIYAIRRGLTQVRVTGRATPTGIAMAPDDVEALDLLTKGNAEAKNNFLVDPSQPGQRTLWGVPVVETEAVPAGTALVGDFRRAILFDREDTSISVGTIDQQFVRNILTVLAESRAAFGVTRPSAFCAVDLAA